MTTPTMNSSKSDLKKEAAAVAGINAFQRRQTDNWKQACAHLIPFYPLYYAITRQTITPLAYSIGLQLAMGIMIGLSMPANSFTEQAKSNLNTTGWAISPAFVILGIKSAKTRGKTMLRKEG